ncbi:TaqI-like C-terminal specificity domain-containing protein [Chryseobacterium sp. WLY505]|uniref:TaqI-like C-terminal specificity domain-containing protein n=1 Tax=Chryseobacterium sp. WLY505 TaxID=3068892 RepID=UPI002796B688|nr:TaqI-like C-terminal specificity domain-containing protein [Chryseobacterium sp. WLY505]MDQ1854906.1 TaqI-like C-terminal specificity domain-containing protein [Chryseobacterium sp. WLY505]
MSDYFRQFAVLTDFNYSESWVVLSSIEKEIKRKIETIGTPLKDWDINIYRGVLTGYNEAFIIDGREKARLIKEDPKSAEIIRPILRGRDVKRFGYDFADLWLINTHNGIKEKNINPIDIENYPAIKKHLNQFYSQLTKRSDKGVSPYNLRNCAYMEDFYKQKIIYPGIMRIAKSNLLNFPRFTYDESENFFFGNDCYFIIGEHIEYIWLILNSTLLGYLFRYYIYSFDETGFKMFTDYFKNIPIPKPNHTTLNQANDLLHEINIEKIDKWVYSFYNFSEEEVYEIENFVQKLIYEEES